MAEQEQELEGQDPGKQPEVAAGSPEDSPGKEQGAHEAAEQVADAQGNSPEQPVLAELTPEEIIEQLREEVGMAQDAVLRAQAEAQNARRRATQDVEKARKFALEGMSKELVPVMDNLERALEATAGGDEAMKPIAEGVELTLKSFLDVMKKFNIEPVDPHGEPFDPHLHQAMSLVENPDVEPNTVIAVMQKGYVLNGRLLRPAMVLVSKAAS